MIERRRYVRVAPATMPEVRATVRPGCMVTLVDVSAGGALLQGERPLRPGARVQLQVPTGAHTIALFALVLRSIVWALSREGGVTYRGALQFELRSDWLRELVTRGGYTVRDGCDSDLFQIGKQIPDAPG
ncbi:MAG: PilZ domain-containing protein [Acidobacteria bacterium]|nr:PilZ domain-containing protein [Acidobacteriota bacterium]MCA1651429.1 PilZ domain-containing protein [Acidobacteriota bacterium]